MPSSAAHRRLERLLAVVLRYSTWLASAVIAFGVLRILADAGTGTSPGTGVVAVGIAMLIAIPGLRVVLMAVVFAFEREYLLVAVAAAVLSIIAVGLVLGMRGHARTSVSHPGTPASRARPAAPPSSAGGVLSLRA
jgi:uncharacterized membrane protein